MLMSDVRPRDPRAKPGSPAVLQETLHQIHHVRVFLQIDDEPRVEESYLADCLDGVPTGKEPEKAVVHAHFVDREERASGVLRVVDCEVVDIHRSEK